MIKRGLVLLLVGFSIHASAEPLDTLGIQFPTVPAAYEKLNVGKIISKAQVDFNSSEVSVHETNGYTVTDPYGNTFVVDNIQSPVYAFYATYIDTSDDDGLYDAPEVDSQVYIENLNFGNF